MWEEPWEGKYKEKRGYARLDLGDTFLEILGGLLAGLLWLLGSWVTGGWLQRFNPGLE